jgi:hypothetical protein
MAQTVDSQTLDRLSLWIVLAIGFLVIIFSVYQVRTTLFTSERNTSARLAEALEQSAAANQQTEDAQQILADQSRDDDGDGLNNFEETAQYGTSPYLIDSDSDSIGDAEEIANGTDPTCPEGEVCAVAREEGDGTLTDAEEELESLTPTLANTESDQLTREQKEAALLERGLTQEQLDTFTDQEISDGYTEIVEVAERGADPIANVQQATSDLLSLTSEEKRALLVQSGVQQSDIDTLSDEDIDTLVQEAVDAVLQEQGAPAEGTNGDEEEADTTL